MHMTAGMRAGVGRSGWGLVKKDRLLNYSTSQGHPDADVNAIPLVQLQDGKRRRRTKLSRRFAWLQALAGRDVGLKNELGSKGNNRPFNQRAQRPDLRRDSSCHRRRSPVFRRSYARYFGAEGDAFLADLRSISSPSPPVSPLNGGIGLTGKRGRKTPKLSPARARRTTTHITAHFM